jgi:hypothetical protein
MALAYSPRVPLVFLLPFSGALLYDVSALLDPHQPLWLQLLVMVPITLAGLGTLVAYVYFVRRSWAELSWLALLFCDRDSQEKAFCVLILLVPFFIFSLGTINIWDGQTVAGSLTGQIALQGFVTLLLGIYPALYYIVRRGWDDDDRGDDPDQPDGPPWWPDFERQFRAYTQRRQTKPRTPAGVA